MNGITRKEPIVFIGIIAGAIIAALEAAIAGDVLVPELGQELIRLVQVVVAIVGIVIGRMAVYSPATRDADVETALRTPVPEDGDGPDAPS